MIAILTQIMEETIRVVSDYIMPYRRAQRDFTDFFTKHQVHVVVYDLAPPYDVNWNFFQSVRAASPLKTCAFVLTTTNTDQLEALVGPVGNFECIGNPLI